MQSIRSIDHIKIEVTCGEASQRSAIRSGYRNDDIYCRLSPDCPVP
jgi:hypothetical protein